MALNKYKLGDLITISEDKNSDGKYGISDVKGVSIEKKFIETKANLDGVSLAPYLLVKPNDFCYVTVTSRNGEKITLAHNDTDKTYIVSSSYIVFYVDKPEILDSTYLFMYFRRPEFDRYSRYNSWGSARETFSWEEMCNIDIELPSLEIQQKYVNVYKAMVANQKSYEKGLGDLKLVCDAHLDNYKKTARKHLMGALVEEIDSRNDGCEYNDVRGVNIEKTLIPSKSISEDLGRYKVVRKGQFVYSSMQTGRDECIRLALMNDNNPIIVSPAYSVLQSKSKLVLNEYIMLWFSRKEVDRMGAFLSDSSVRANLDLPRFYEMEIPVPDIDIQYALVAIHTVYLKRREINIKLKEQIKKICPVLIQGALQEGRKEES